MSKIKGLISECYFCGQPWGCCMCAEKPDDIEGFEFEGTTIVDPCIDATGCFFVDPTVYYGEVYTEWYAKWIGDDHG